MRNFLVICLFILHLPSSTFAAEDNSVTPPAQPNILITVNDKDPGYDEKKLTDEIERLGYKVKQKMRIIGVWVAEGSGDFKEVKKLNGVVDSRPEGTLSALDSCDDKLE